MSTRRRSLLAAVGLVPWVLTELAAAAARPPLRVVLGADAERYADALRALRDRFGEVLVDDVRRPRSSATRPAAYIALGPAALQQALDARLDAPVVSLFASRQSFERATASTAAAEASAIYAEPNPEHQMRLVSALFKRSASVGMLLSEATAHWEASLRSAAAAQGLRFEAVLVRPGLGVSRALNSLETATVLVIQPDSSLYTQETLRELLESTYRRRLPVIGFSSALVSAGTLASAYSGVDDVAAQLQGVVDAIGRGRLPAPRHPVYWRVAVNDSVARSLDVVVDQAVRSLGDRP